MAKVEGMPLEALEHGVPWNWSTFGEYLDRLDGKLGVNAGFLVGHCALRRKVMGAERGREVADRRGDRRHGRSCWPSRSTAGGLGFSSSQSRTHSDGDGNPINSRYADRREMLAFCEEVAAHEGTTLEYITDGCLDSFSDEEMDLMVAMTATAPPTPQLEPARRSTAARQRRWSTSSRRPLRRPRPAAGSSR